MWNKPSEEELSKLPAFYSTEKVQSKDKIIHMHFFMFASDWYVCEYSQGEKLFFGFVILNDDLEMAEWGYFSLDELSRIKVKYLEVDRDLHFKPRKAVDVDRIREAQGWMKEDDYFEYKTNAQD